MIVELQRFVEFNDGWSFSDAAKKTRAGMNFEPMTINTEYVASVRRYLISGGIEFCEVRTVDFNGSFIFDKTYEEMRDLLKRTVTHGYVP